MNLIDQNRTNMIGRIFTETKGDVFSIFRQACIPVEECEDLTQDVFVKLMNIDLIDPERVKSLVITIAYRTRTDYIRHKTFVNKKFKDNPNADIMERGNVLNNIEAAEVARMEMKAISCMSEMDAKVYTLSRFEEKSTQEMVQLLDISARAIESRLYRARIQVRNKVAKAMGM